MRDAVSGLVQHIGSEIIEHEHGRPLAGKVVFECEKLAPITQGALSEQPDLGETIEYDARRLHPLDRSKDELDGFSELEVGRIKQALILVRVEHTFWRLQFKDFDVRGDGPAVDSIPLSNSCFVSDRAIKNTALVNMRSFQQEPERQSRLAGARASLD